jgi:putative tricarboxylic transport membrane protein
MKLRRGDFALGLAAVVFAAGYLQGVARIPESLLSDAVGAAGMPRAVGWAMAVVGGLLCLHSLRSGRDAEEGTATDWRAHLRAMGLLALLVGYVVLAPWIGYTLSTGLLLAAAAAYAGAPRDRLLLLVPLAAAALFWLLFVQAFGIPMPAGALFGG